MPTVCNFGTLPPHVLTLGVTAVNNQQWWAGWRQTNRPDCGACALLIAMGIYTQRVAAGLPIPALCGCGAVARPAAAAGFGNVANNATAYQDWLWHMVSGRCTGFLWRRIQGAATPPTVDFSWPRHLLATAIFMGWANSRIGFVMNPSNPLKFAFRNLMTTSLLSYHLSGGHGFQNLRAPTANEYCLALVSMRHACVPQLSLLRGARTFMSGLGALVSIVPLANTFAVPLLSFADLGLHYIAWDPGYRCWRDPHRPWLPTSLARYVDTGIRVVLA